MRYLTMILVTLFSIPVMTQSTYLGVRIEPEQNSDTYDRDDWKHWIDANGDSQDARQEALIAESLVSVVIDTSCSYQHNVAH